MPPEAVEPDNEYKLNECYRACEESFGLITPESGRCFDNCDDTYPLEIERSITIEKYGMAYSAPYSLKVTIDGNDDEPTTSP